MSGTVEITQEEYKMLLEDHITLSRAERALKKKKKELYYASQVAEMLDIEWDESEDKNNELF